MILNIVTWLWHDAWLPCWFFIHSHASRSFSSAGQISVPLMKTQRKRNRALTFPGPRSLRTALYFTSWAQIQCIFFSQLKHFKTLPFVTISAVVGEGQPKSFIPPHPSFLCATDQFSPNLYFPRSAEAALWAGFEKKKKKGHQQLLGVDFCYSQLGNSLGMWVCCDHLSN